MKKSKDKQDDRDWVPVSDIDEELDLPVLLIQKKTESVRTVRLIKSPERNLGYR